MKAVTRRAYGSPDVLELADVEKRSSRTTALRRKERSVADALRHLGEGHARGELVVTVP